jgi:hypothetical protein
MTLKSTLIGSALDKNYSFNLKQMNTAQKRENKYTVQRQNKQICENHSYYNEKEKQLGGKILGQNRPKITPLL